MVINFEELLMDYSDESFDMVKNYLSDYISCFYVKYEDLNRMEIIEKISEYTMMFESKNNNKKDSSIPKAYTSELKSLIKSMVESPKKNTEPCQAFKYFERAEAINDRVSKSESENLMDDLEDITKIFLCFENQYLKNGKKKITSINFKISGIAFDNIKTELTNKKLISLPSINDKNEEEIINNVLSANYKNNIYSVRNYLIMILSLFYVRLVELEG